MTRSALLGLAGAAAAAILSMPVPGDAAAATDPAVRQYCTARYAAPPPPERESLPLRAKGMPAPRLERQEAAGIADLAAGRPAGRTALAPPTPRATVVAPSSVLPFAQVQQSRTGWGERYPDSTPSGVVETASQPFSTFSADVDTASLSHVRRWLEQGRLPPADAVRPEEMVNAFDYAYPAPASREEGFRPTAALYPAPWRDDRHILAVGVKGWTVPDAARPDANLVLLLDVSGSMRGAGRLPLVKQSVCLLLHGLQARDTLAIVTYAAGIRTVLAPTSAAERETILGALDRLQAGGGTAGAQGLDMAYAAARMAKRPGAADRVILATDGDFNIGPSDPGDLTTLIRRQAADGIDLNVVGVGGGNTRDDLMQALAQNGNGIAVLLDGIDEAERVFVDGLTAALTTVSRDVKFQIEFNPATITSWRLIGYETRALQTSDFRDDAVDAGEVGSGLTVTALYEVTVAGLDPAPFPARRYADGAPPPTATADEYARIALRFVPADGADPREVVRLVGPRDRIATTAMAHDDLRFATAVAWFARKLRGDALGDRNDRATRGGWPALTALAAGAVGDDPAGRRAMLVGLIRTAAKLDPAGG
ncbi:von Willebrand factor type A domain-containing protein [Marinibaculum pumilum]|uniref:von Willebrand factor type A domain-containing protein n=1 Tax=Marinibaculum pumilum TaxID=1766165 RepID=A0ABV7KVX0_9PROT